jgi:hypothetical protein
VERNRGATDRSVEKIAQVLDGWGGAAQSNPGSRR